MTKYTNRQLKEMCRSNKIHNDYNFAKGQPYIYYIPGDNGRMAHAPYWSVFKEGTNLGTAIWRDGGAHRIAVENRDDKEPKLEIAKSFAKSKFGITEWARGPFGAYYEKSFVEKRLGEIIGRYIATHKESVK